MKTGKYAYLKYQQLSALQKQNADNYLQSPCFIKSDISKIKTTAKFQVIKETGEIKGALL